MFQKEILKFQSGKHMCMLVVTSSLYYKNFEVYIDSMDSNTEVSNTSELIEPSLASASDNASNYDKNDDGSTESTHSAVDNNSELSDQESYSQAQEDINDNSETSDQDISAPIHDNNDNLEDETINDHLEDESMNSENIDMSDSEKTRLHMEKYASFERERLEYQTVLEKCNIQLRMQDERNKNLLNEISELKIKINQKEREFKMEEAKMKAEFLTNIEKLSRECSVLRKEKETIVIRYANSEKEVIVSKKFQHDLEKKIQEINRERDLLASKLKNAVSENNKLSSSVENKMVEVAKLQKEHEKLNADLNSREIKIKWLQNNLKSEVNAHQDTQIKLEHTSQRLNEMREEAEQVRRDCQEMIKRYQEAEEIKSVKLDGQLKQKLSELEVQKQEKCDQEQIYMLLRQELEALKKKQRLTMEDNNSLTLKINGLEKERLEYEQTLCKLKDAQNKLKDEITDLTSQLAEMEGLKLQLEQEKEKSAATLREVERLRLTNAELQSDIDACHLKEGDRLDFVEKLTAKTMLLQSDHCLLEVKAQALEDQVNQLSKNLTDLQAANLKLAEQLEDSRKQHENEMQLLIQKLAEKAKNVEKLNTNLEEAENEHRVLKRRHITSIKELSHELYQCRKQLEYYESNYGVRAESISLGSRTSSSASLHISNMNDNCLSSTSPSVTYSTKKDTPSHQAKNSLENQFTVDKEMLIDRIINLQKMLAKKTDKIDFLEDHIEHLVKEMRKKSKTVDFKNV